MKFCFVDRDGVINRLVMQDGKERSPRSLGELVLFADSKRLGHELIQRKFVPVIITNQPDLERGLLMRDAMVEINNHIMEWSKIPDLLFCPHTSEQNCECRKPKASLARQAMLDHSGSVQNHECVVIGDTWRDMGMASGIQAVGIHLIRETDGLERCDELSYGRHHHARTLDGALRIIDSISNV